MKCNTCGASLPPGAAYCTTCGSPTPYNVSPAGSSPQMDPTVAVPPYGAPGNGQPQVDQTEMASPPPPAYSAADAPPPPSTAYGAPPYGAPPPQQYPYQANQYGAGWQPGTYRGQPQPPKKRSRLGLILGIIGGVLLLLCIGTVLILYQVGKSAVSTVSATETAASGTATNGSSSANATATAAVATVTAVTNGLTPTTGSGNAPSGNTIDPTAAGIITNPQTASAVDTKTAKPTKLATTFPVASDVYVTVDLNMGGKTGYIQAKWYAGMNLVHSGKILNINDPTYTNAYFAWVFDSATQGTTEVYWCTQKDCSDAKLAEVIKFSVSSTGMHRLGQPVVAGVGINRPD